MDATTSKGTTSNDIRRRFLRSVWPIAMCVLCLLGGLLVGPHARQAYDWMFPPQMFTEGDFSAVYADAGKSVVLFATSTCHYCRQTRELLTRAHVDFKEWTTDQSEQAREKFAALGGEAVPLLFVGHRKIVGYDERAIRESLALVKPDMH